MRVKTFKTEIHFSLYELGNMLQINLGSSIFFSYLASCCFEIFWDLLGVLLMAKLGTSSNQANYGKLARD